VEGLLRLRRAVGVVLRHGSAVIVSLRRRVDLREPEKRSVPPTPSHHAPSSQPPLLSENAPVRAQVTGKDGTGV